MLLSVQQKYILAVLREARCLRKNQLYALVQGRFGWTDCETAQRRVDAMLRQLRNGVGELAVDADFVWLGNILPDARRLEAVDVMLE